MSKESIEKVNTAVPDKVKAIRSLFGLIREEVCMDAEKEERLTEAALDVQE